MTPNHMKVYVVTVTDEDDTRVVKVTNHLGQANSLAKIYEEADDVTVGIEEHIMDIYLLSDKFDA